MIYFLHNFLPSPIFWQFGPLVIRYYGIIISLAIVAAVLLAIRLKPRHGFSTDDLLDLVFYVIIFGVIGARAYEVVILEPRYFFSHPAEMLMIWHGGLAIHGAIIGGLLTLAVWCRLKRQNFWRWTDLAAVVLPLAQAIGRWGNYFNQEVFGRPTSLAWGIPIEVANRPLQYVNQSYFHPTFLYESVLDLLLFVILFSIYRASSKKNMGSFMLFRMTFGSGQYLGLYLVGYGLIRFLLEFMRSDQTAMLLGHRWPQIFSLLLIIVGLIIFNRHKLLDGWILKIKKAL